MAANTPSATNKALKAYITAWDLGDARLVLDEETVLESGSSNDTVCIRSLKYDAHKAGKPDEYIVRLYINGKEEWSKVYNSPPTGQDILDALKRSF